MSIGGAILELLFPTKCAFCHRLTEGREQRVCPRCIKSLPYARGAAAEQKLPHIVKCVSPFYYEGESDSRSCAINSAECGLIAIFMRNFL